MGQECTFLRLQHPGAYIPLSLSCPLGQRSHFQTFNSNSTRLIILRIVVSIWWAWCTSSSNLFTHVEKMVKTIIIGYVGNYRLSAINPYVRDFCPCSDVYDHVSIHIAVRMWTSARIPDAKWYLPVYETIRCPNANEIIIPAAIISWVSRNILSTSVLLLLH